MSDAIEKLRQLTTSSKEEERLHAVEGLFQSRDMRAVPLLRQMADSDPSLHVRYMAQRSIYLLTRELGDALDEIGPIDGDDEQGQYDEAQYDEQGAYDEQAYDEEPQYDEAAYDEEQGYGEEAQYEEEPMHQDSPGHAAQEAPSLKLPKYKVAYENSNAQQRAHLVKVAVHYKSAEAVLFLCEQAEKEVSPQLKGMLLVAIGMLGGPEEVAFLAKFVDDPVARVRFAVVDGLEHIGHPSVFPLITRFLSDDDSQIRLRVVAALKRLGKNGLIQLFNHMLDSGKLWMRDAAAYALSVLSSVAFLPVLKRGMRDPEREVRRKIRTGIERLIEKGCPEARQLLKSFSDQTMAFEDEAAELFANIEIGASDGPDPLFDDVGARRLKEVDRIIEERDSERLTALCAALQAERDPEIRGQMVKAVGLIGDEDSIKYLVKRLTDNSPTVRTNSVEAIAALCPTHIPEDVELLLYDEDPMVRASAVVALKDAYPRPASRTLEDMASHRDIAFREAAFFAVSAIANDSIVPIVVSLAEDGEETVRQKALELISQLRAEGNPIAATIMDQLPEDVRAQVEEVVPTGQATEDFEREFSKAAFGAEEELEDFQEVKIPDFDL